MKAEKDCFTDLFFFFSLGFIAGKVGKGGAIAFASTNL